MKVNKQEILVQNILDKIGGTKNIKDAYNCATRLRLTLYNQQLANIKEINLISNIKGALWANGELQLIIGQEVPQITNLLKKEINKNSKKNINNSIDIDDFKTTAILKKNIKPWQRFLKSVSAIFGPLIPFLVGVGLIMALQQLLFRMNAITIPEKGMQLGKDYNIFDFVLNVISGSGFKMMGVIAMWSTVRYLGGKTPIAIALSLIMISPLMPEEGIHLFSIGSWDIIIKPFYSTILVFIVMGIIIAYGQKIMDKYFNSVVNFILNPFLTLLFGGLLAFFIMGPIMGVLENAMLVVFNWFMTLPLGIGVLIVGLTWQPLVVLGVHNILFFAAVTELASSDGGSSIFLAAAFAAAWAQMGAAIGVGLRSKKTIDKSAAFAAALPGIISGPTESVIYGVNLPKGLPFITGVIAGGIGGWMIGLFGVDLDNLAGLGGIVGFLAYTDDLVAAILIDIASLALGIVITYIFWKEDKIEKNLALKTTKLLNKKEFLSNKIDYQALELIKLINKAKKLNLQEKQDLINKINNLKNSLAKIDSSIVNLVDKNILDIKNNLINFKNKSELIAKLKTITSLRQEQLNNIYKDLLEEIKMLKDLNNSRNKYLKLLTTRSNAEFKLNRIKEIEEDKIAKLFNKHQILLETNKKENIDKADHFKLLADNFEYKKIKQNNLNDTIYQLSNQIEKEEKEFVQIINKKFILIETKISEIEKIKNSNLTEFKNKYFNDLNYIQIKNQKVEARLV